MKRFRTRRTAGYAVLLLAIVAVAVVAVASAQAAPLKKKFDAYVVATGPSSTSFVVTLVNDTSSQQTLGSADFSAPGLTISPIASTGTQSSGGHSWTVCTGSGGTVCGDAPNNVVEFRANSSGDALAPGESVSFTVPVADPTGCTNATWGATAKQSNDFSGTNNIFNLAANDLTPLGSFRFDPVESIVSGIHVPQIVVNKPAAIRVTALDTCKNPDTDYPNYRDGSKPTLSPVSGLAAPATSFSALSWSAGVGSGTVTPGTIEVGDSFSIDDSENGISATSVSTGGRPTFDVVETICAAGDSCKWSDKNNPITATSTVPNGNGQALGLAYKAFPQGVSCTPTGGSAKPPVGDSIYIDPYQYSSPYTIVLTYGKAILPNAPASSFIVCKNTDQAGQTWDATSIPPCPKSPSLADAPCADPEKTPGGNLQVTLYLNPGDPRTGGFSP